MFDRIPVSAGDLGHFGDAPAQLPERRDVLVVRRDDFGGLLVRDEAGVLKMADQIEGWQLVEGEQRAVVQPFCPATLRITHDRGQQPARNERMGRKI